MKLMIVIVHDDDATQVVNELTKNRYSVTRLNTTGGFLKAKNATLLVGVDNDKLHDCVKIISDKCSRRIELVPTSTLSMGMDAFPTMPAEVEVGGATIFVVDVEQFIKL